MSAGMLLCSSNEDHSKVSPLCPPAGVPLGELVSFEGHLSAPVDAGNRAGKAWKKASKTLVVDDNNVSFTGLMLRVCITLASWLGLNGRFLVAWHYSGIFGLCAGIIGWGFHSITVA